MHIKLLDITWLDTKTERTSGDCSSLLCCEVNSVRSICCMLCVSAGVHVTHFTWTHLQVVKFGTKHLKKSRGEKYKSTKLPLDLSKSFKYTFNCSLLMNTKIKLWLALQSASKQMIKDSTQTRKITDIQMSQRSS